MKRVVLLFTLVPLLMGLRSGPASSATENLRVVSSFDIGVTVDDLAWDGEYLWAATGVAIYKLDTSGNTISSWYLYTSGIFPMGITWDGEYLWIVDAETNRNYKISKLDTSCNVVSSFVPDIGRGPVGIAWDGEHLWVTSTWGSDIYELDTSGNVISSFSHQGPWGITWDGNYLWVPSSSDERIYQLDTSGNVISSFDSPVPTPRGMAWDGEHLWVSDRDEKKIYQLQVASYYELHTSTEPQQGGSVNVSPLAESYVEGTQITLTAVSAENYEFDRWSGDASGTSATVSITMNSDKTVTAHFSRVGISADEYLWILVGVAAVIAVIAVVFLLKRH